MPLSSLFAVQPLNQRRSESLPLVQNREGSSRQDQTPSPSRGELSPWTRMVW